jgi:cobalamin biosynthetic protein CobC
MSKLIHGGDLYSASLRFGIPEAQWLDLSTGINPNAYPHGQITEKAFTRLPYLTADFKEAVENYYGPHAFLALSGSQEIIQSLPRLLAELPIILPSIGYQEHREAWKRSGGIINNYDTLCKPAAVQQINSLLQQNPSQHLLLINPNNPSGLVLQTETILDWSKRLTGKAMLVVDEAFIDSAPDNSLLCSRKLPDNLLVLRSFGKFFGLAGIRAGFLFGNSQTLSALKRPNNPWPINGIAQEILCRALNDAAWQKSSRTRIEKNAEYLQELISPLKLKLLSNQGLFQSYVGEADHLSTLFDTFCQSGILLRLIPVNSSQSILRFGLIDHEDESAISRIKSCIAHANPKSRSDHKL